MKGFFRALQNLTRIYITDLEYAPETFGRATLYFPLVGLVIGLVLFAVNTVAIKLLPVTVVAALVLVIEVIITGGMHLDGFIDSMDGLFSGRPKERKLEIMKDSRVGANGVIGMVCLFLLKFVLIMELMVLKNTIWLVLTPVISRWCMVYAIRFFPYARPEGMGKAYHFYTTNKEFAWASIFTILISTLSLNPYIIIILIISIILTHLMSRNMTKNLGGLTGDTYGAITEIMEVVILIMFYLIYRG